MPRNDETPNAAPDDSALEITPLSDPIDEPNDSRERVSIEEGADDPSGQGGGPQAQSPQVSRPSGPRRKVELDLEGLGGERRGEKRTPARSKSETSGKARARRLPLLALILIPCLLGLAWFSYHALRTGHRSAGNPEGSDQGAAVQPTDQASPDLDAGHPYRLDPFFVPVSTAPPRREAFLKVTFSLVFRDRVPSEEIDRKLLKIRGEITDLLWGRSFPGLQSEEGKRALQGEIKNLVNARVTQGTVQRVYFEEFYIL